MQIGEDKMKVIYKFRLSLKQKQEILLPTGFKYLDIQPQDGQLMLWALVDENPESQQLVKIHVYATGERIDDESTLSTYLKTVKGGSYVWHIFGDLK